MDINKNVLEWSSEDVIVPYIYQIDGKKHRYFVDFWMKVIDCGGVEREYLVEVKPRTKLVKPSTPKRKTKQYKERLYEYVKNINKFEAAHKYCRQLKSRGRDISFKIVTESELGIG